MTTTQPSTQWKKLVPTPPVDIEALREKYAAERARRMNKLGADQYLPVPFEGKFAHFDKDLYASGDRGYGPVQREVEVLVIGGGFMGLVLGADLTKAGVEDFVILDVTADFGGTWYWNRYPGVRCDVESYIYMPLLEEIGTIPTEKYSTGPEIFAHLQQIAHKYDLYRDALFQTTVTELRWDEAAGKWLVSTNRGDLIRARYVAMSIGLMHRPKLPGLA